MRRGLASLAEALSREFSGAELRDTYLSRLDPRAKIVAALALIVGATLLHTLLPLAILFVCVLTVSVIERIDLSRFGRIWLSIPIFSLAIMLPALLNVVTPGQPLIVLMRFADGARLGPWHLPHTLAITQPGVFVAARFLLRVLDTMTLTLLLTATTEPTALINSLRRLGMPRVFGMVMAQRYVIVILRAAEEIHLAKLSRTIGEGGVRREQQWVAAGIGTLFRRTMTMADEVHSAMLARGYDGEPRLRRPRSFGIAEGVGLLGSAAFLALLLILDIFMRHAS